MSKGMYEIVQVGVSRRYVVYLKDESGNVVLTSQYRELKPMCLNEISWMRNAGLKDSLYEFIDADDGGLLFNVRATDAHVLGNPCARGGRAGGKYYCLSRYFPWYHIAETPLGAGKRRFERTTIKGFKESTDERFKTDLAGDTWGKIM